MNNNNLFYIKKKNNNNRKINWKKKATNLKHMISVSVDIVMGILLVLTVPLGPVNKQ